MLSSNKLAFITALIAIITILQPSERNCDMLELLHIVIIIICSFSIFAYERNFFSLYKTFHLFTLFFIGIAPVIQFKNDVQLWMSFPMNEHNYLVTSSLYLCIIIVFNCIYHIVYHYSSLKGHRKIRLFLLEDKTIKLSTEKKACIIIVSLFAFFMLLQHNDYSLLSLLFRGGYLKSLVTESKMQTLLVEHLFQPVNMLLLLFVYNFTKERRLALFLALMTLLCTAPTSLPRYAAATLYFPLLLSVPLFRKKNNYVVVFIFGLLVLFPVMSIFRDYNKDINFSNIGIDNFANVDYDSYFMFAQILKYDIVTNGNQLLGALFFWFPRAFWADKAVGSGQYVAEKLNYISTNISCNIYGEAYINFGMWGVVAFALLLPIVIAIIDKYYWSINSIGDHYRYSTIIYIIIGTAAFLLFRGDLQSSTAYIVGFVVTYLLIRKLMIAS